MRNEDLQTFLFELEVLCRTYDYLLDLQKLKLYPETLKDGVIKWLMGLGTHTIKTWEEIKNVFFENYRYHCMPHDLKYEVFKMMQKEDESLEDLVEIFSYNIKISKMYNLDDETIKSLLLKYIRDEWIDLINLIGKGDVSQLSFREFFYLCKHISRGKVRTGKKSERSYDVQN